MDPIASAPPDLASLEVLVVDCQTTGATPERGHLLEVAWARLPAAEPRVRATVVSLPDGDAIPPRIQALTGIRDADLEGAPAAAAVWQNLVAAASFAAPAPAVAHFARFERAFLEALHDEHGGDTPFPLDLLCTHEIACRLLPGLPRRGLKALAGHLGLVLGETKRATAHVEATIRVWTELARRLADGPGVRTVPELRAWMDRTPATRRGGREFTVKRETRLDLPDAPGVYRMLGRGGEVLYLGKATSLKRRVNGYFQKRRHGRRTTLEMLTQVHDLDVTPTATPLEAALLEVDEIKRLHPPYNVQLRERDVDAYFVSPRLDDAKPHPDGSRMLGPLPAPDALAGLAHARTLLASSSSVVDQTLWVRALELEADVPLDEESLRAGLVACRAAGGFTPGSEPTLGALLGWGARLWRTWREAAEEEEQVEEQVEEEDEDDEDDVPRGSWAPTTPEEAQAALQSVVRRGAHLLRRGRWLRRLSVASLRWQPAGDGKPRLLVLEEGRVLRAEDAEGEPPAPPGWPRSATRRLEAFDAATHDRLRVLTTELRRLVASGRDVRLRLDPRTCLDGPALARRLFWV